MCQYLFIIYPFVILGCIFLCFELIPGEKSHNKIDESFTGEREINMTKIIPDSIKSEMIAIKSADEQCKKMNATHACHVDGNICQSLHCFFENSSVQSSHCTDMKIPADDGTICDASVNKTCYHGQCIDKKIINDSIAINNQNDNNDNTNVFIKINEKNESQVFIRLEYDGRYINISLNESDSFLGRSQTPIYLAEKKEHDQFTTFRKYTIEDIYLLNGVNYENVKEAANNITNSKITGKIGSHGNVIEPSSKELDVVRRDVKRDDDVASLKNSQTRQVIQHQHKTKQSAIPEIIYPELLIVVDNSLRKKLGDISRKAIPYILNYWNSVDMRFRGLTSPEYKLNIAGIVFAMDDRALEYINNHVNISLNVQESLPESGLYWYQQNNTIPISNYDILLTMTTYNLQVSNGSNSEFIAGQAKLKGACMIDHEKKTLNNYGIIQDLGNYDTVTTAAHELGHLLGADHDGEDTSHDCKLGYIMSSGHKNSSRLASYWSPCTLKDFNDFLREYKPKCLYNKPMQQGEIIKKKYPGELINANDQCMNIGGHIENVTWQACNENYSNICISIKCTGFSKNGEYSYPCKDTGIAALDGTLCGTDKYCINHRCITKFN